MWARPSQLRPGTPGAELSRRDWQYWLVKAGRGFGKTRTGAETVREWEAEGVGRIALVGPTAGDARDVMVEGESGILACCGNHDRPEYEPAKRRLTWRSGTLATLYSADEPERLRGPQHEKAWGDEIAAWRYPDAWDNLLFGLRLGLNPQAVITTTPKPNKLIRDIMADPNTVITSGRTYDNRANLAPAFLNTIIRKYEGTRLGRQELDAEMLEDLPGALWTRALIEASRLRGTRPQMVRVVIAVDPAVSANDESDETGIVAVGLGTDGHLYVMADLTLRDSPLACGKVILSGLVSMGADRVVAEVNNGGDLVARNLYAINPNIPFRAVRASHGKMVRAEPVAALYEQGRVHHVGTFERLEDQMCGWVPGSGSRSPDRLDALVWGITDLVLDPMMQKFTVFSGSVEQISPY